MHKFLCCYVLQSLEDFDLEQHLPLCHPRGLDMSPYMLGEAANQFTDDSPPIYDLYATVNHYGNVYLGHYASCVKPPVPPSRDVGEEGQRIGIV